MFGKPKRHDTKDAGELFVSPDTNPSEKLSELANGSGGDWMEDYEGQLAVDVYQTESNVIIKAPVAGVKPEDIDITISDDVVTIKGERKQEKEVKTDDYYCQECYWGSFSRSVVLPIAVATDKAKAEFKDGILIVKIPKSEKAKVKKIKVKSGK